jgi:predicted dehydrogenase
MNRRNFISSISLAATGARRTVAANDKVNVAIVGTGSRGQNHVSDFIRRRDANLVAVCDVDTAQTERAAEAYYRARNSRPRIYQDKRRLFEARDVDAVIICTPNHWHALAGIWACEAGKDAYVEKPVSYNVFEGERLIAAARRHSRIVQGGMQRRSSQHKKRAIQLLREGVIGDVYMARGLCFKRRKSIGRKPDTPVPAGVDWDLFLGPAPMRPYNENRHRYNWHWFWDTGNGDIGNQGIHELDYARWGLNKSGNPKSVFSFGAKYVYDDDQETPNTQTALYDYGDAQLSFEVRGLPTGGESELSLRRGNFIGVLFYGSNGYMTVEDAGFKVFLGDERKPGESMAVVEPPEEENTAHVDNFLDAVRTRRQNDLVADVREAAISADLIHMANISFRLSRKLVLEPGATRFVGDEEANRMLTRPVYRAPYVIR